MEELQAGLESAGLQPKAPEQHVNPLLSAELAASFTELVEVETGKLDGVELGDVKRAYTWGFLVVGNVRHLHACPHATLQQPGIPAMDLVCHVDARVTEVLHGCPVPVFAGQEAYLDPVNEPVGSLLTNERLRPVRLIVPEIVALERVLDGREAELDLCRVVGCAEPAQQILQHVGRHVLAALDEVQQVLSHDLACEYRGEFGVERIYFHGAFFLLERAVHRTVPEG